MNAALACCLLAAAPRLFEKTNDGAWFSIPAKGLTFPAQLGMPVQFSWAGAGLELDLALGLSVAQP